MRSSTNQKSYQGKCIREIGEPQVSSQLFQNSKKMLASVMAMQKKPDADMVTLLSKGNAIHKVVKGNHDTFKWLRGGSWKSKEREKKVNAQVAKELACITRFYPKKTVLISKTLWKDFLVPVIRVNILLLSGFMVLQVVSSQIFLVIYPRKFLEILGIVLERS